MQKILIVEDDEKLRNELQIFLNNNGYKTESLTTFENTINDILKINPDLILLDINLPNCDGQYICREIRKMSQMPIIIITSRDSELDELKKQFDVYKAKMESLLISQLELIKDINEDK